MTRFVVAFAASALLAMAVAGDYGAIALWQARQRAAALATDVAVLREQNDRLRRAVEALANDPATIEFIARAELGLLRRDEKVVRIADVRPR